MIPLHRLAAPLVWSAYIVQPSSGWGLLDGLPLGVLEACALALVWWAWAESRHLPGWRLLSVLVLAKIAFAGVLLDRGFTARYYANDSWTPPVEQSVEFQSRDFTRLDERLAFGTPGAPDLPLYFFNDLRFNYFLPEHPERERLPYSVEWRGYLRPQDAASITSVYLDAGTGIAGELSIDGTPVIRLGDPLPQVGAVDLSPGWHLLVVRLQAPYGAGRHFEAGALINGQREPFDTDRVVTQPVGTPRLAVDRFLNWISHLVDLGVLSWLAVIAGARTWRACRKRRIGPLLWLVALFEAVHYALRHAGGLVILTGGDDWLAYESFSRAIALGDWIRAGQPDAFYYQPLYSYVLAVTHLLFGDGLFGAVFVQRLLLAATVGWVFRITTDLFGSRTGWIALVGGGIFLYVAVGAWTDRLLSEMIFIPLLMAWVAMLTRTGDTAAPAPRAIAAGVVGGLATLTRSTLLLAWPPVLLLWAASLRARRLQAVGALLITMTAVVGTATLRNWIVTGTFVPVASSFGINLYLGNTAKDPLEPAPANRVAAYERLGVDGHTRTVAEFLFQRPAEFIRGLGNKALYTVGFFRRSGLPGGETMGTSWSYVGIWVLAVAGMVHLVIGSPPPASPAVWIGASAAATHVAVMVLVIPFGYGDRYILPLYPPLIPYAAYALGRLPDLIACSSGMVWGAWVSLRRIAAAASGPVITVVRAVARQRRSWVYLLYTATVLQWNVNTLAALILPALALGIPWLASRERVSSVLAAALWGAALTRVAARGSMSPDALSDPLFWGMIAALALAASWALDRWAGLARATAALAGGSTMLALVLQRNPGPMLPGPGRFLDSIAPLMDHVGPLATLCLLVMAIQTVLTRGTGRVSAAMQGGVVVAAVGVIAGAPVLTGTGAALAAAVFGMMIGLVEADARRGRSTPA